MEWKNDLIEREELLSLSSHAAFSAAHQRRVAWEGDYRSPYKRDTDAIIHSKAYNRYVDKTQVVYLVENDHITHRSLHVQLVSSYARGLAKVLRLNQDLVEAIALGHDVGHPPFGHEGELYLSALSKKYDNHSFTHSLQSCRLLSEIESLNLCLAVYDGFLCHDGGLCGPKYLPKFGKTWEEHEKEKQQKKLDPHVNIWPTTLEGCLVKVCDTVSYVARDLEDAILLKIIKREQIPDTVLGLTQKTILSRFAENLLVNSLNKEYVAVDEETYNALRTLRKFNFQYIYTYPALKIESTKIKQSYQLVFETLLQDYRRKKEDSYLWQNFLSNKSSAYLVSSSPIQQIVDYISGMTDSYFIRTMKKLILPQTIELENVHSAD